MRSVSAVLILVVAVLAIGIANPTNGKPHYDPEDAPVLFQKFIKDYNRHYKDEDDYKIHYNAFVDTLKVINRSNAGSGSATFDINKFADYTKEEKKSILGLITDYQPQYAADVLPVLVVLDQAPYEEMEVNVAEQPVLSLNNLSGSAITVT